MLNTTTINKYLDLKQRLIEKGFAHEISWTESVMFPDDPRTVARETIWVICNSGMKFEIANRIFRKVIKAISFDHPASSVFGNKNKCRAIEAAWKCRSTRYVHLKSLRRTETILDYLQTLDGIGPITKYHLARNIGIDVCKPDRHLERIAKSIDTTPHELCSFISEQTGDRIGTVDVVLWRAAVEGRI